MALRTLPDPPALAQARMLLAVALALLVSIGRPGETRAQTGRLRTLDATIYDYVERLQERGHLLSLNPTAFPYPDRRLAGALREIDRSDLSELEAAWIRRLRRRLDLTRRSPERNRSGRRDDPLVLAGIEGTAGGAASIGRRLSTLRPLGAEGHAYPFAEIGGFVAGARWGASASVRHDWYFDRDPDGLDAVKRYMSRSQNSYVGYDGRYLSVYLGRYGRHWGKLGDPSTLLSTNPRTIDHLSLRLGTSTLSVRGLLGELDSMNEDGTFTGRAAGMENTANGEGVRRFLAGHRWDWRVSRSLLVSLMETAVYSGRSASPSLTWANPVHPFVVMVDNTPKNDENNGLVGLMVWARSAPLTWHGQLMIDDVDLKGVAGEPASLAAVASVTWANVMPRIDLTATTELVAARAYNAPQPEGRYQYLKRGLAGQFSDYVRVGLSADWYGSGVLKGWWLTPRLDLLWQGEADYHRPYPPNRGGPPTVLAGETYRRVHLGIGLRYRGSPLWSLHLSPALNLTADAEHEPGRSAIEPAGTIELELRLPWTTRIRP